MTQQTLSDFIAHLAQSPELLRQVAELRQSPLAPRTAEELTDALARIAAGAGFAITPADLLAHAGHEQEPVPDQQLDAVSGGTASMANQFAGLPNAGMIGGPLAEAARNEAKMRDTFNQFLAQFIKP